MHEAGNNLISIKNLEVHYRSSGFFFGGAKTVKAVDGVSLEVRRGETLGLVGESGCGKSTLGRAILRLTEPSSGSVFHDGSSLADLSREAMRRKRKHLQMVFQDPYSSLNPSMTIGRIIAEPIRTYDIATGSDLRTRVHELMGSVGLSREYYGRYPREFSGGQRQRVAIARALAVEPEFIVADEPISALDVSIQSQIMNLLKRLQAERGLTYLFISHDLRAVRYLSDRIAVMYLGRIVETAASNEIYHRPLMPYTQALISAIPSLETHPRSSAITPTPRADLDGFATPDAGCSFEPRCPFAIHECKTTRPKLSEIAPNHVVACIRISPQHPNIHENVQANLGAIGI